MARRSQVKRGHRKAKRAAEVGTAVAVVLGIGAAVAAVAIYNRSKQPTASVIPGAPAPGTVLPPVAVSVPNPTTTRSIP